MRQELDVHICVNTGSVVFDKNKDECHAHYYFDDNNKVIKVGIQYIGTMMYTYYDLKDKSDVQKLKKMGVKYFKYQLSVFSKLIFDPIDD